MEPPDDGRAPPPGMFLPSFQAGGLASLPEYIIQYFLPSVAPLLARYPTVFRRLAPLLTVYWFGRSGLAFLTQTLNKFRSLLISTATVSSRQEDLYEYVIEWISKQKPIQASKGIVATEALPCQYITAYKYSTTEDVQLTCLGRSTQPLENLLEDVYRLGELEQQNVTVVRRACGERHRGQWQRAAVKAKRAIDTVILPTKAKTSILADMAEYLDLKTNAEYQARGIPYRRRYLFHGPPGTGKTSLAMALAGHFGLDVYIVSLLDKSISDATLLEAVAELPQDGSLLLFEDVDASGLDRKLLMEERELKRAAASARAQDYYQSLCYNPDSDDNGSAPYMDAEGVRSNVSLGGLLNAIDGAAAPEGHVLIMTTNHPDKLDSALVRAGRVDFKVGFTRVTKAQARDVFLRQFERDDAKNDTEQLPADLADSFAQIVPEDTFTPAELQNYLLSHKARAQQAIDCFEEYKKRVLVERTQRIEDRKSEQQKAGEARQKDRAQHARIHDIFSHQQAREQAPGNNGQPAFVQPSWQDLRVEGMPGQASPDVCNVPATEDADRCHGLANVSESSFTGGNFESAVTSC